MDTFLSPDLDGKYQVFFSHKEEDAKVAHCIKDLLDRHTENVIYFITGNIEKGTNWRQTTAEQLTLSSFFVGMVPLRNRIFCCINSKSWYHPSSAHVLFASRFN